MSKVNVKTKELLRSDREYYTGIGKEFLSNSDIGTLLKNPEMFGVSRPDNKNFAEGRYFHQLILEPEKAKETPIVDYASRSTKGYKEAILDMNVEVLLLKKEAEQIENLVSRMKSNLDFFELIYAKGNKFEEPEVKQIKDTWWKGKADIVHKDYVVDLKTTSNIDDFKWNARKYNYDSQAWVYKHLFGKPMLFLVIEKTTGRMGMFTGNEDFYERGEVKVNKAIEIYNTFFSEGSEKDITHHYIKEEI
jgi:hypothetical protein